MIYPTTQQGITVLTANLDGRSNWRGENEGDPVVPVLSDIIRGAATEMNVNVQFGDFEPEAQAEINRLERAIYVASQNAAAHRDTAERRERELGELNARVGQLQDLSKAAENLIKMKEDWVDPKEIKKIVAENEKNKDQLGELKRMMRIAVDEPDCIIRLKKMFAERSDPPACEPEPEDDVAVVDADAEVDDVWTIYTAEHGHFVTNVSATFTINSGSVILSKSCASGSKRRVTSI
jgi:hypothetical protein